MEYIYFDTVVVGTGAAGYNAANKIKTLCDKSVCIVTEGIFTGTSRNTGSDKQTYYKLSLGGDTEDSVRKMATDLFSGGAVDGDNALAEAAASSECFFDLVSLGVPFPKNRYGEYTGYKTDHDPYMRATSAGPLTSKFMTEALEKQAEKLSVPVFGELLAVEIIKDENSVRGLLCLNKKDGSYKAFQCNNIVLATGGPAGIYEDTVYPEGHTGSTALALEAGAQLQNMTEWQYGLSSKSPKWNVSGTYMQVLPRFVSVDETGNEYEFLKDSFQDIYAALSTVFLKGYQWPFDSKKAENGSSLIDLAVYNECVNKKRKVYLDYTRNPFSLDEIDFSRLSEEAYSYLKSADALFGTPVDRLIKMNRPAYELYKSKGVDLKCEKLEIALSAQHNNGGIAVDLWWQTKTDGLFAAGECAGTHGISRPGGSALNSGQAGSLRAARYIAEKAEKAPDNESFSFLLDEVLTRHNSFREAIKGNRNTASSLLKEIRTEMSAFAAAVRDVKEIKRLSEKREEQLRLFPAELTAADINGIIEAYKYKDSLITGAAVLFAMKEYIKLAGKTRGSAVYKNFTKTESETELSDKIQAVSLTDGKFSVRIRDVRPLPEDDSFFENVWKSYRENKNIY
ncbi:MAG: FAD-binding protein [Ruminococcaceae bacterium]|nr:FAD-binding protein [Oscillospiraceae bacterium]